MQQTETTTSNKLFTQMTMLGAIVRTLSIEHALALLPRGVQYFIHVV
jgi:hypothetical protein